MGDVMQGAMLAIAVVSAGMKYKASRDQAKAVVAGEALKADRNKKLTFARASKQKASFLASGITLEGTPLSVMNSTFDVGKADIEQGIKNANRRSRNIIGAANAQLAMDLAGAVAGAAGGGDTDPSVTPQTNQFQGITKTGTAPSSGSSFFGGTA